MSKEKILAIVSICVVAVAAIVLAFLLHSTSGKLKQTQAELATTKATLQTTETAKTDVEKQLAETQKTLSETESTLEKTRSELSQTQEILQNASEAARKIAAERHALQQDKDALRAKLTDIESELQRIREQSQRSISAIQERFKDTVGAVLDEAGRLKLDVKGKILFETGSAILSAEGKQLLNAISEEVLLNTDYSDYAIRVEGHTDNAPIGGDPLRNWNLSTERAIAAVKYLQEHANVTAERLAATGYAFYQPIDTAETPEAKAKNRRIEIILVPPQDFLSELLTSLQTVMQSIGTAEAQ